MGCVLTIYYHCIQILKHLINITIAHYEVRVYCYWPIALRRPSLASSSIVDIRLCLTFVVEQTMTNLEGSSVCTALSTYVNCCTLPANDYWGIDGFYEQEDDKRCQLTLLCMQDERIHSRLSQRHRSSSPPLIDREFCRVANSMQATIKLI